MLVSLFVFHNISLWTSVIQHSVVPYKDRLDALSHVHGIASHHISTAYSHCPMPSMPVGSGACFMRGGLASAGACVAASGFVLRGGRLSLENKTGASPAVVSDLRAGPPPRGARAHTPPLPPPTPP